MIVATAADCKKGFYSALERKLRQSGISLIFGDIRPFSWRKMILWEQEIAEAHSSELVVFVDAWDFLFLGSRDDLFEVVAPHTLLFHSDSCCWPQPQKMDDYPAATLTQRWRYVNGTGPAGQGSIIADAISYGMARFPIVGDESSIFADNDQRFWTDVYLSGLGDVDVNCKLSQSMQGAESAVVIEGSRVRNTITGSRPQFLHANGGSLMQSSDFIKRLLCA
jgi:hypothetical protein